MVNFNYSSFGNENKESLPSIIASHIMNKIFAGELEPGDRLIETEIAKELDVSNIPVREAFYVLQSTGIVERVPRKGVRVKAISEKEFEDYTDALIELFGLAVDYSEPHWNKESYRRLQQYLQEAENQLLENNISEYVVKLHRLCGFIIEVADNQAFIKFYSDITFITNAYSRMRWGEVEKTKERFRHAEIMVEALSQSNFAKAKESFEMLTRQSLNL